MIWGLRTRFRSGASWRVLYSSRDRYGLTAASPACHTIARHAGRGSLEVAGAFSIPSAESTSFPTSSLSQLDFHNSTHDSSYADLALSARL